MLGFHLNIAALQQRRRTMKKIMVNFFDGIKNFFETAAELRLYSELKLAGKESEAEKIMNNLNNSRKKN
jgi:hypothetical protein